MLKQSASGVLASLRGSTYRSVRLATSLAAALLDGLFEHPAWCAPVVPDVQTNEILACPHSLFARCDPSHLCRRPTAIACCSVCRHAARERDHMVDVVARPPARVTTRSLIRLLRGLIPCNIAETDGEKWQVVKVQSCRNRLLVVEKRGAFFSRLWTIEVLARTRNVGVLLLWRWSWRAPHMTAFLPAR